MAGEEKVDIKVLQDKLDKGEKITPAEEKYLLENQAAPEGYDKGTGLAAPAEEGKEKEVPAAEETPEAKAAKEKEAQDLQAKEALVARAKAVNLPDTATKEEIESAEEAADENDPLLKVERLLQKPDDKVTEEDLKGYTPREKAYYHQMRRERKARQDLEAERDAARFELSKLKKVKEDKPAEEVVEKDPLEGKEPGDFITVADAKKILEKANQKKEDKPVTGNSFMSLPFVQSFIKSCDEKTAAEKPDYENVMELTEEIVSTNPAYQKQVAEALLKGENPALKMYELIKADPEFAKLLPAAETRVKARKEKKPEVKPKTKTAEELKKEKEAADAERKLKENTEKEKTTGHLTGKEVLEGTNLTLEQISAMSDREFAKLPKKTREKYLELYG